MFSTLTVFAASALNFAVGNWAIGILMFGMAIVMAEKQLEVFDEEDEQ